METIEELRAFLEAATQEGVRGQLLYRGTAWSLMRTDGVLPDNAPPLGKTIDTDLAEYGFALLRAAMALRGREGNSELGCKAFEQAARAFEALVRNAKPEAEERGFRRTIAAAAYHLAGYSAVAYSLFNEVSEDLNSTPGEVAVMHLILRDLDSFRVFVRRWLATEGYSDVQVSETMGQYKFDLDSMVALVLNTTICRALAHFDFGLQTGEVEPIHTANELLATGVRLADAAENVPLWWIINICLHLIDDLWSHSLHQNLPIDPPDGGEEKFMELRQLFIGSLYARKNAEVELWPSQREAARRSTDLTDNLVVALPTSAGKTRVAELAALMTLSCERRVLIVTPLRALSAQTERSFRKTFSPLGFSVSALYGATGLSNNDEDALRSKEIIIATPEKLDFALRNDPSLIKDVGLIVLDEGHMIGASEREIRYETLLQRLLRRADAVDRRIVCLSATLPSGDELNDLTEWIRNDEPGDPVRTDWRPTRQRFGMLTWRAHEARLSLDLAGNGPFIDGFVKEKLARGREKKPYPRNPTHLSLFAAWEFAAQGKRTLIYSPQANWVEGYAKSVVDLVERGYLQPLLNDEARIAQALEVGKEWLGETHPAVMCLRIGVAIHHGRLPNPFLRELEILLSEGVLQVIVASPTLSQGLNLNAAVLLVPSLYRSSVLMEGDEFGNVAGRAGRAFVDVEGLIVHVMFDKINWRTREWKKLVQSLKARTLKSGLIQIVAEIIIRLTQEGVLSRDDAWEYLANSREAWKSTAEDSVDVGDEHGSEEDGEKRKEKTEEEPLAQLIERLDTTVFGLIEALDADQAELSKLLDEALNSSLWARQIARESEETQYEHRKIMEARASLIWSITTAQARKGHFAMGVGLEAGLAIDAIGDQLGELVDRADMAALSGDVDELANALAGLAEQLLFLRPFVPDKRNPLPGNWKTILRQWISGADVSEIGPNNMKVVEDAFMYRLVWALEAIRMRRVGLGWSPDIIAGGGAATLETGVPQFMMAMLIRAGLPSRRAAMIAIDRTNPVFTTTVEMKNWLESTKITDYTNQGDWPTPEAASLWVRFRDEALNGGIQKWQITSYKRRLDLSGEMDTPPEGFYRILPNADKDGRTWLSTPDYKLIAPFETAAGAPKPSLFSGYISGGAKVVNALRVGSGRARWPFRRRPR